MMDKQIKRKIIIPFILFDISLSRSLNSPTMTRNGNISKIEEYEHETAVVCNVYCIYIYTGILFVILFEVI